jgi:uncharacterized protein YneF (UPF0154 family)
VKEMQYIIAIALVLVVLLIIGFVGFFVISKMLIKETTKKTQKLVDKFLNDDELPF